MLRRWFIYCLIQEQSFLLSFFVRHSCSAQNVEVKTHTSVLLYNKWRICAVNIRLHHNTHSIKIISTFCQPTLFISSTVINAGRINKKVEIPIDFTFGFSISSWIMTFCSLLLSLRACEPKIYSDGTWYTQWKADWYFICKAKKKLFWKKFVRKRITVK